MASLPPPPLALLDGASLFLDFDGTLVDFVIDPAAASVDQRLRTLLGALAARLDGRLAILSGRSLDELTARLDLGPIAMAGSHGLERRSADGQITCAPIPPGLAQATDAADTGLELQSGKCVRELKVPGADKGDAVRAFMAEPPFTLGRPVVVGDDLTDEHAFIAAIALGGSAILVGDPRPTAAQFRLPAVDATLDWLGATPR